MTASIRRSRMHRTARGKRIELSTRDFVIFECLERYRYLRSTYLFVFAGGASLTRFQERLGDLFHEGYLSRPEQQWQRADARCQPVIYEIGAKAREALRHHGSTASARATYLGPRAHRQFAHSLMICECLASIELATVGHPNVGFVPWSAILARSPESTQTDPSPFQISVAGSALVPDGLFGIEYHIPDRGLVYRFFAVEVDRGTMPIRRHTTRQTSFAAKLDAYETLLAGQLYRGRWRIPNLLLLTLTTSEARNTELLREVSRRGDRPMFLFKSVEETTLRTPVTPIFHEPWQRSSTQPLNIVQPNF